jgi:electron transport complex protein RnfB
MSFRHNPRPRKTLPARLAVIDSAACSGCQACAAVCPVDSIATCPGPVHPTVGAWCAVDLDRCVGCRRCAEICPWQAIAMVDSHTLDAHAPRPADSAVA